MPTCTQCQQQFEIPKMETDFLAKIHVPEPAMCPSCRRQWRFAWRNERILYHRKCNLTGKQIISIYAPDSPYKVYDQHEWYTDKWSALNYGRDFDFGRMFFDQFNELMLDVPKLSLFTSRNENSDYTNGAQQDKDCYMIFVSDHNRDCYYSYAIDSCEDCTECFNCYKCTLCVECIDCSESYNLAYCNKTHSSRDSRFLYDCKNCQDCFECYGMRNKQYCILNQQYSREEYERKMAQMDLGDYRFIETLRDEIEQKQTTQQTHQYYDGNNNENVTGDHIVGCKNCIECYDSGNLEDCGYLIFSFKSKDCFDGHVVVDNCQLCYNTIATVSQYNTQFTFVGFYSKASMYLDHCLSCQDCFACSGLKHQKYCIFNKQYSCEEYENLKTRIIKYMEHTGEFGMPLPPSLSPFGYNETVAQEYFPLSKEEVIKRKWKWRDPSKDQVALYQGPKSIMPGNIKDAGDDIVDKIFNCEKCNNFYKIIPQELRLYKKNDLPLPRMCFNDRHMTRVQKRNPRKLYDRNCQKCGKELKSTYAQERSETIYCEKCYLETL